MLVASQAPHWTLPLIFALLLVQSRGLQSQHRCCRTVSFTGTWKMRRNNEDAYRTFMGASPLREVMVLKSWKTVFSIFCASHTFNFLRLCLDDVRGSRTQQTKPWLVAFCWHHGVNAPCWLISSHQHNPCSWKWNWEGMCIVASRYIAFSTA